MHRALGMWNVWALVLIVVWAIVTAPAPTTAQPVEELERKARALFDEERYAEAVRVLESILKEDPAHRAANVLLSFAFARLERPREAAAQTRRAVELFPENTRLQLLLAGLLAQQDATRGEGIQRYQEVLRQDPTNRLAQLGLAEALRAQGQTFDAIHGFQRLAEANPDDPRYVVRLGQLYASLGDLKETRKFFERAYALAPENVDAVRALAVLGDVEDEPQDALRYYQELARLLPHDVSVQVALRAADERRREPQFPIRVEEMEATGLETYTSAVPQNSKQLQQRVEQLKALRFRSYTRFLPSFFVAPSSSTTKRESMPGVSSRDESDALSYSFGWNLADIVSNPFKPTIVGLEADFQALLSNLMADVTATYYQRLQNILEYRRLQRALALSPFNAQLRQSKQATKYAILNLTERLRIITGIP